MRERRLECHLRGTQRGDELLQVDVLLLEAVDVAEERRLACLHLLQVVPDATSLRFVELLLAGQLVAFEQDAVPFDHYPLQLVFRLQFESG